MSGENLKNMEIMIMSVNSFNTAKKAALKKYFSRMNEMQQEAVFTVNGPVLVLAGAGSGKTTVIVNRIANMINFGMPTLTKQEQAVMRISLSSTIMPKERPTILKLSVIPLQFHR